MITDLEKELEHHFNEANKLGLEIVEQLARQILIEHKELDEFIMAMGSYFFTYKKNKDTYLNGYTGKSIRNGEETIYVDSKPYLKPLNDFLSRWDDLLKLTGEPMRFTAKGEKITDW